MGTTLGELRRRYGSLNLSGKNAVVVGATAGLGRAVALRLAQAQANVTVVGRSAARGQEVVNEMKAIAPQSTFNFVSMDAMLLKNIHAFCAPYLQSKSLPVDYLVMTQGIATIQGRTLTEEGLDQKMALHCYSRMALVDELAPVMMAEEKQDSASPPVVISVLSGGYHSPYTKYDEDVELVQNYSLKNAADAAGFYNDIGLSKYAEKYPGIKFVHSAPGFVATSWGTEMPAVLRVPIRFLQNVLAKSPADAAEFLCEPIFNNEASSSWQSGKVQILREKADPSTVAKGAEEATEKVWAHLQEVIQLQGSPFAKRQQ